MAAGLLRDSNFRWVVLSVYILSGIASQLVWITYAPILTASAKFYQVPEADIGLFAAVFPLVYLIISILVGYYIDKYGFRKALITGMLFLGVFSFLRSITPLFIIALAFQTIAGIGQPFVMNSISKLVRSWFPESETALATGLGTLSLMLGILITLSLTPFIVYHIGIKYMLFSYGIYSLFALAMVFIFIKEPKAKVEEERAGISLKEMMAVLKNKNILILSALFFLGVGIYTAFTTWIEPLIRATGLPLKEAGMVGGLLTLGGIFGSIIIPGIADRVGSRKKPMIIALVIASVSWSTLYLIHGTVAVSTGLFVVGFLFLSLAPLALDLSVVSVGINYSGAANSVLWEFSQIGSLILIWIFEIVGQTKGWPAVYLIISALTVLMFLLGFLIKEQPTPRTL